MAYASSHPLPSTSFGPERASLEKSLNVSDSERLGSLLAGALLLGYGVFKRSIPYAALGGYLAYRGQSGRCRLYDALGVNSRDKAGSLREFTRSVTVNRPRKELFQFLRSRPPAGNDLHLASEREDELLCWSSAKGDRLKTQYAIELEDMTRTGGTLVRARVSHLPDGGSPAAVWSKLAKTFTAGRVERDLRDAKQLLETGEIASTKGQSSGPSLRRRLTNPLWRTT